MERCEFEDLLPAEYNRDAIPDPPEKRPEDMERILTTIQESYFMHLHDKIIQEKVARYFILKDVAAEEAVVQQGQHVEYFYVIAEGHFEILTGDPKEPVHTVTLHNEGCFMEEALIKKYVSGSTIIAKTPGKLWTLNRRTFHEVTERIRYERRKKLTKIIQRMPLFKYIHPLMKVRFREIMKERIYRKSAIIYEARDRLHDMFIIVEGSVRLHECDRFGNAKSPPVTVDLVAGQYFAQGALTKIEEQRSGEIAEVLEEDTLLMCVNRGLFERQFGGIAVLLSAEHDRHIYLLNFAKREGGFVVDSNKNDQNIVGRVFDRIPPMNDH